MNNQILGKVISLYIAPIGTSGIREEKTSIEVKKEYGIVGDKFANSEDKDRLIMLIGENSYKLAKENNIDIPKVALGENLLLDFDPHTLNSGDTIQIGNSILEITKECTLCKHLTKYNSKLPKLLLNKRGIYAKILKSGTIKKGDDIILLEKERVAI